MTMFTHIDLIQQFDNTINDTYYRGRSSSNCDLINKCELLTIGELTAIYRGAMTNGRLCKVKLIRRLRKLPII